MSLEVGLVGMRPVHGFQRRLVLLVLSGLDIVPAKRVATAVD